MTRYKERLTHGKSISTDNGNYAEHGDRVASFQGVKVAREGWLVGSSKQEVNMKKTKKSERRRRSREREKEREEKEKVDGRRDDAIYIRCRGR